MFSWKSQYVKSEELEFESWFYPQFHLPALGWVICLFFCFGGRDSRTQIFHCRGLAPQPLSCSWINCISECDAYSKETYYFIKLLFQLFNFVCLFTYIQICKLGYYNYSILEYKIIILFLNWPYNLINIWFALSLNL